MSTATEREQDLIAHYLKHGDPRCSECQDGFNVYWIEGKR